MEMCRIVFSGELLDGFHMQDVQKAAALRLRVDDAQLARLFSGEPTVLKKAVSDEACTPYVAELARMGMRARVEVLAPLNASQAQEVTFKVVFWGKTIRGYTKDQVMRAMPRRLNVDEAQVVRLFGGGKAVLKRNVSAEVGARYVTELARIGMQVELEIELESLPVRNSTASQVFAYNAAATGVMPNAPLVDEDSYGNFLQTQVDLQGSGTLFSSDISSLTAERDEAARVKAPPTPPTKEQVVERLASAIEQAYAAELGPRDDNAIVVKPEVAQVAAQPATQPASKARCAQCGHRQASGSRCEACGCALAPPKNWATSSRAPVATRDEEMTRSLHDELEHGYAAEDEATLMREMRHQGPTHKATERRAHPVPVIVGGACVLAAVAGWVLLSH